MSLEQVTVAKFEFTLDDYRALQTHICRPVKRAARSVMVLGALTGVVGGLGASMFLSSSGSFVLGFLAATFLFVFLIRYMAVRNRALLDPSPNGAILCSYEYSLGEEGLRCLTPHWDSLTRWSGITGADETETHLFLMFDKAAAYAIPKRAFSSPADAANFLERVRAYLAKR